MKTNFMLLALSTLPLTGFAQAPEPEPATRQLRLGPVLGNLKVKDLQASPLMYVANPKGLQLGYSSRSARQRFHAVVQASASSFIAPAVGPRELTFTDQNFAGETTANRFVLAPQLYQASLDVGYLRRLNAANPSNKWRSYAGLSLHNWLGYADGVALTTWAVNAATLNATAAGEWQLHPGHRLTLQGALPLAGLLSRLPYSNVLSYPDDKSYLNLFFSKGTRLATWNRLQRLQLQAAYELDLSARFSLQAQYQLEWQHYSRPRSITTFANLGTVQLGYRF